MGALGKKVIEGSLTSIWPRDLVSQVMYETKASVKHFKSWVFERSRFRGKKNLKLNIGCGANTASGWINIDLEGPAGVFRWDCRRSIPFDDDSVDAIFAEHVFEHFDPATGEKFLAECHRCLRTDGTVRIVVPDAGRYIKLYSGDWSNIAEIRPLIKQNGGYRDYWLDRNYKTKMEFINEVFRQGTQHKFAYDLETLVMKMHDAGFTRVVPQSFGVSAASDAPLDTASRGPESLYVEGIK
jgi:predicted SAM-dependent methyltransferase